MLKMKLRGKTLLVMLLVAVVPLSFSMIFLSNFTNDQIRSSMTQYAEKSSNFVARSTPVANRNSPTTSGYSAAPPTSSMPCITRP